MNENIYERFEKRMEEKKAAEQLYPATLTLNIVGTSEADAKLTLNTLIKNLSRFTDMKDVKGEMQDANI